MIRPASVPPRLPEAVRRRRRGRRRLSGWLDRPGGPAPPPAPAQAPSPASSCGWTAAPATRTPSTSSPAPSDGGPFKPIQTSVPGIQISEHFPKLATLMQHGAIIRGMSTGEGAHGRAKLLPAHRLPGRRRAASVYPQHRLHRLRRSSASPTSRCPTSSRSATAATAPASSAPKHQPLVVTDPTRGVENLRAARRPAASSTAASACSTSWRRASTATTRPTPSTAHQHDLPAGRHPDAVEGGARRSTCRWSRAASKAAYGTGHFGEGCLLARRLVEVGVPFVEVTLGGWDTHQNNFDRVKQLSGQVDPAMAPLIDRPEGARPARQDAGHLDGRVRPHAADQRPRRRARPRPLPAGLEHRADRRRHQGRPGHRQDRRRRRHGRSNGRSSTLDFMATVCRVLGIDYTKQNQTADRPARSASSTRAPTRSTSCSKSPSNGDSIEAWAVSITDTAHALSLTPARCYHLPVGERRGVSPTCLLARCCRTRRANATTLAFTGAAISAHTPTCRSRTSAR